LERQKRRQKCRRCEWGSLAQFAIAVRLTVEEWEIEKKLFYPSRYFACGCRGLPGMERL